ncbi:TPA: hypothetical protein N6Z85_004702, partial [Escherichia coli]|nr:hypothetical protein [Escherichia coli]
MKNRKKVIVFISSVVTILLFFVIMPKDVYAGIWDNIWDSSGGEDTVKFLQKYQDYLSYSNFLTSILNAIGLGIIKGLYILTAAVEGLIPDSLNLLDFLDNSGLQGITKAIINDLVVALMVLMITYLGIKTIIAKEPPNFKSVGVNIFISAFLIVGLPSLMNTMEEASIGFYDATQTSSNNDENSSLAWNLIQENTTDLLYVSSQGF